MGWIKTVEALYSVRAIDDNVVYVHEPNLGLQASLVRCIGWRYDWTSRCLACGKYPSVIVHIFPAYEDTKSNNENHRSFLLRSAG